MSEGEGFLVAEGWDDTIIGVADYNGEMIVVYSADKIIDTLVTRDKMTNEQAVEFFSYNIQGAYVGAKTPIFVFTRHGKDDLLNG